jgi:hypothetical protein
VIGGLEQREGAVLQVHGPLDAVHEGLVDLLEAAVLRL